MGSAWIGGHLPFSRGVGVNQTAFASLPEEWTAVAREAELPEATLVGVTADGADLLLVRHGGSVHAMHDCCSHRGCSLHEGMLEGDLVRCPCHGSAFRLDGTIASGPATSPQPVLEVRERDGANEVRRPPA
jgi:nitrite reductase/ring-hydroxylating ferredoxin subunit